MNFFETYFSSIPQHSQTSTKLNPRQIVLPNDTLKHCKILRIRCPNPNTPPLRISERYFLKFSGHFSSLKCANSFLKVLSDYFSPLRGGLSHYPSLLRRKHKNSSSNADFSALKTSKSGVSRPPPTYVGGCHTTPPF